MNVIGASVILIFIMYVIISTVMYTVCLFEYVNLAEVRHTKKLIKDCELNIPRNQSCVLIAMPKDKPAETSIESN